MQRPSDGKEDGLAMTARGQQQREGGDDSLELELERQGVGGPCLL